MFALRVEVMGLSLIAELVIFSHSKDGKQYQVRGIAQTRAEPAGRGNAVASVDRLDSVAEPDSLRQ